MPKAIDRAIGAVMDAIAQEEGPLSPKKKLVIESAVLCFANTGYAGTSTRMIADHAGVSEGTIFRHFGTKKAMFLRICEPVVKRLLAPAAVSEAADQFALAKGNVRLFVQSIMQSRLDFADLYEPFVRILLQEILVDTQLRDMVLRHARGVFNDAFQGTLRMFRDSGQIRPMPETRLLRIVVSLLAGYYINRSILAPGKWDDAAEIDALVDFIMEGVATSK